MIELLKNNHKQEAFDLFKYNVQAKVKETQEKYKILVNSKPKEERTIVDIFYR